MNNPLVSIIIPLYNVEKYIAKCLESVSAQSYSNYEVIIVDDGSTDSSASIAKEYVERDSRFNIITQKNTGVSTARNTGLERASGDYVVFIDADDFIAPDYLDYMLGLCCQSGSDFCLSKNAFTQTGEKQIEKDEIAILSPEQAVALLLSPRVIVGCWNKIYRRSFLVLNAISFSTNLFYGEGLSFITRVADRSNSVCVGLRKVYYYRRNNEASATTRFSIEKLRNGDHALEMIKQEITSQSEEIDEMFMLHKALYSLGAVTKLINSHNVQNFNNEYTNWKRELKAYTKKLSVTKRVSFYRKCMLWGGVLFPTLTAILDRIRRKHISNNSFY